MHQLEIIEPKSIEDAVQLLAEGGYETKVLGGGTAVVLMYRQGLIQPRALISLAKIPDFDFIRYEPGSDLYLGPMTTHRRVEMSPVVRETFPVVAEVFHQVANIRVRNQATIGGVLAEADYASDPPTVLVALEAEISAFGPNGERKIPIGEFFQGFYQTALAPDEIITGIKIPRPESNTKAVYLKYVSRSSEDRPCVGVAVVVRAHNGLCDELRVAVGAVKDRPQRLLEVERMAHRQRLNDNLVREVARKYAENIDALSDIRGSGWYRKQLIEVLVRRGIEQTGVVG